MFKLVVAWKHVIVEFFVDNKKLQSLMVSSYLLLHSEFKNLGTLSINGSPS